MIEYFQHENELDARNMNVVLFMIWSITVMVIAYFKLFRNTKLLLNEKGISLYSRKKEEPSTEILWGNIRSMQIGHIYNTDRGGNGYSIKITYTEMLNDKLEKSSQTIPVKKYEKYKSLIKDIEQIGEEYGINVFYKNAWKLGMELIVFIIFIFISGILFAQEIIQRELIILMIATVFHKLKTCNVTWFIPYYKKLIKKS